MCGRWGTVGSPVIIARYALEQSFGETVWDSLAKLSILYPMNQ